MLEIKNNEELDRLLNLLSEYTNRSKSIYDELSTRKRRLRFNVALLVTAIYIVIGAIYLGQEVFHSELTRAYFYFISMFAATLILLGLVLKIIFKIKFSNESLSESLWITRKQLKSMISFLSQYLEHKSLSYIRKEEIKLRIIEAEEVLKVTNLKNEFFKKLEKDDRQHLKQDDDVIDEILKS